MIENEAPPIPLTTATGAIRRVLNIVLIVIASGVDNMGIYLPLFAKQTKEATLWTIMIFFVRLFIWNCMAQQLANLPIVRKTLHQYKNILVPSIFVFLGLYILFG